jgi:AhpD family alkylhydroperoxidase
MRFKMQEIEPDAWKAMYGLAKYVGTTQLSPTHLHLLNVRASQLNGCAFCLNMHTQEARTAGETEQRLYLLSAWRETTLFTPAEKALLALCEEVTLISQGGVSTTTYQQAVAAFDERYVAQALMAIVTINGWNRIAVATQLPVEA